VIASKPVEGEGVSESNGFKTVSQKGRYIVSGGDGYVYESRARMTLCRCGNSQNKPFCDGTHAAIGFRDAFWHAA
jgi:CDGSH-type Zn-finger protein